MKIQEEWRLKVIAKFGRVFEILRRDTDRITTLEDCLREFNDRKRSPDTSPHKLRVHHTTPKMIFNICEHLVLFCFVIVFIYSYVRFSLMPLHGAEQRI